MAQDDSEQAPTFEEALSELQTIANVLEEGAVGLDESLAQFERGVGLLRHCYAVLESAEGRITELTGFDAEGNPVEQPLDATATAEQRQKRPGRRKTNKRKPAKPAEPEADDPENRGLF